MDDVDSRELDQRKTLPTHSVLKSADENDEFEKQRTAAIAEVAKNKEVCKLLSRVCIFITCYGDTNRLLIYFYRATTTYCNSHLLTLFHNMLCITVTLLYCFK